MNKTSIPWADYTWNPITGCTKGCDYCYARGIAQRFKDTGDSDECAVRINEHWQAAPRDVFPAGFAPTFYQHRLDEPLRLKKPSIIFLGSMGDLFDPAFPDEFRDSIFATVAATPQHTYMLLTKQPEDMKRYVVSMYAPLHSSLAAERPGDAFIPAWQFFTGNAPNLWLGVTVTNQADADERIPLLLDTPAAHRFVSVEPMLGPIHFDLWIGHPRLNRDRSGWESFDAPSPLDAVIVGAKTPGKALHEQGCLPCRASDEDCEQCEPSVDSPYWYLRSLRDQCLTAGVHFHYKHGKHNPALDGVVYDWRPEVAS